MSVESTLIFGAQLTEIHCGGCGGIYAINENYRKQKYQEGGYWNCPYCKISWGFGEGENTRLKNKLAQEKHRAEQEEERLRRQADRASDRADRAERRRAAMKGQVTKIKNRVGKGVCPCCSRCFVNLQRHMTGQHPDWAPDAEETK